MDRSSTTNLSIVSTGLTNYVQAIPSRQEQHLWGCQLIYQRSDATSCRREQMATTNIASALIPPQAVLLQLCIFSWILVCSIQRPPATGKLARHMPALQLERRPELGSFPLLNI